MRWGHVSRTQVTAVLPDSPVPVCCSELLIDASAELRNEFCALVRKRQRLLGQDRVIEGVMSRLGRLRSGVGETGVEATVTKQTAHDIEQFPWTTDRQTRFV